MKSHTYILLTFQMLLVGVFAQTNGAGIYLSALDFSSGKLTHTSKHTRVKSHEIFNRNLVEIKCNDSVFEYQKKDVFGYANKDGVYRFVDDAALPVINPAEQILIYRKTTGSGLRNSPIVDTYFFSKDAASVVKQLTIANLLLAFANDGSYTKLLEICFTRDAELLQYDDLHHKYRINRLLEIAHNN